MVDPGRPAVTCLGWQQVALILNVRPADATAPVSVARLGLRGRGLDLACSTRSNCVRIPNVPPGGTNDSRTAEAV